MRRAVVVLSAALALSGCTSAGTLGLVTRSSGDPGALLRNTQRYREIGPATGSSCRFFLLGVVPWGDGTFSSAVDEALTGAKGDALVNVVVENSLYGFLPLYSVFSYECTRVRGIAIKYESPPPAGTPAPPPG